MEYFKVTNEIRIPAIGMGTGWMNTAYSSTRYLVKRRLQELKQKVKGTYSPENNYTVNYELNKLRNFVPSIIEAQKLGYQLYDTAYSYNNCELMGDALGFPKNRELFFIISKCANSAQREGRVREEFESTLKAFHTDYIDLYLIHWPQTETFIDTWKILEEFYERGQVKSIGVSNFHPHHIEEIKNHCRIMPMVDEVECHPLLQQRELREYCRTNGIQFIAHTSTGKMRSNITGTVLKEISEQHHKTIAQVILRWHYQLGDVSICNSLNPQHMKENLDIFDFELNPEDMDLISGMDSGFRIWPDPDSCNFMNL